jgi:LuxR family maltose regulon positive regulatory protein
MNKADLIIRTKLRAPFTRSELILRPRLQEKIAQGLCGPLTMITAPAGFGKTTLLASSIASSQMPVAWLSLDKEDNAAGRFLNYLIAALQEVDPQLATETALWRSASPSAPPEVVLANLINDLDAAGREIALVLDDYHFISNQAVHSAVTFLIEHCPRTLHLVITSRSDPPLPTARLRARGQMSELRAADLRFTVIEAAQFLNNVMGLKLDARSIAALEDRTEGWIAGLQMASIALQSHLATHPAGDIPGFIEAFSGTNRYILDYLLEEVLASQTPEIQRFLLSTSVLKRLSAPLCDAVLAQEKPSWDEAQPADMFSLRQSASILDSLERANLFLISLDEDRRWYRYHHLFADLLQARLSQTEPGRAAQILTRAAEWCEQNGQVADAINYAFAARDHQRAAELITKHWHSTINNGEIEMVWAWLNALPADAVKSSAPLSAAYCMVLWLTGQVGAIEEHLVDAERALQDLGPAENLSQEAAAEYAQMPAVLSALHSFVARYHEDFEAARALAERALRLIPERLPAQDYAQLHALSSLSLASAYDGIGDLEKAVNAYAETIRWSRFNANTTGVTGMTYRMVGALRQLGQLQAADTACQEAFEYIQAQKLTRLPAAGILHLAMSEVLLERNDLEAAEKHLSQSIELGKWGGRMDAVKNAASALSRLRLTRQDQDGAFAAIEEAEAALGGPIPPLAKAELLAFRARLFAQIGAVDKAETCVMEAIRLAGQEQGQTKGIVTLAACRVQLARFKAGEMIERLSQALIDAEEHRRMGMALELRILRSIAFMRQGDMQSAENDLERALVLAEPEGYARIFLDEGQPMKLLLTHWLAHARADSPREYASHILAQFDPEPPVFPETQEKVAAANDPCSDPSQTANDLLIEPLSQRELEVLHLMASGKTNQEIAQQLVVARGTIKAHAASIYRKLDAANRTEAVSRARHLAILP